MFFLAAIRLKATFDYRYLITPFQSSKHAELLVHANQFFATYSNEQFTTWYTSEVYDVWLSLADFYLFERENDVKGEEILKKIDNLILAHTVNLLLSRLHLCTITKRNFAHIN